MVFAKGVLPDSVIRDPRAEGLLAFVRLREGLSRDEAIAWLRRLTDLVAVMNESAGLERVATVAVGFGPTYFAASDGSARFGLVQRAPSGLSTPPAIPAQEQLPASDVVLYVMSTSEAASARLLQQLWASRDVGLESLFVERGFQRADRRELFGFLDGLRNAPWPDRYRIVFVDRERTANEPQWTEDGTYLAYLKIRQNADAWDTQLPVQDQERVIGRRKEDGSRLDQGPDVKPTQEPPFEPGNDVPERTSHIRKAGPRVEVPQETGIFRRGVPYAEARNGALETGLQFVSFQASLDAFDTILNAWMLNPDFPEPGVGRDQLMEREFAEVRFGGFFFVPAHHPEFIGAAMFEEPKPEPRPRSVGRLFVRKRAEDAPGHRVPADLRGVAFQVLRASDRTPVGNTFVTDSQGHALSDDLPVREPLLLQEVLAPANLQPAGELAFDLQSHRQVLEVVNQLRTPGTY
jgi:Dyp-type peroxidase family